MVISNIILSLIYIVTSCLILIFSKWLYMKTLKYNMYNEIVNQNATAIIPFCGFLLGNIAILVGAFSGPDTNTVFYKDIVSYVGYAIIGIILMILSGKLVEKAILYKFNNEDEIVRDRNIGTAAVYFGIYLASGLIISACVMGDSLISQSKLYNLTSTLIYYVLGMIFLIIFSKIHDKLTPYSLLGEIENDNVAVGIAFAGNIIAIGIILMKASIGEMPTIQQGALSYFIDLSAIIFLLPCVRFLLDRIIVKQINITQEIKNNNIAAGLCEAIVIVSFAILIFNMVDFSSLI